jgi:hypothetical protein
VGGVKLEELPEKGQVLVGNPGDERQVRKHAEYHEVDYLLDGYVPKGRAFLINIDELAKRLPKDWPL